MHLKSVFVWNQLTAVKHIVLPAGCYVLASHLPDVLQRLAVHHTVEFGSWGFRPGAAWSKVGLARVLTFLLVFEHLGVLDDGGGKLSFSACYSQTLSVDVLVDAVLYVRRRKRSGLIWIFLGVFGWHWPNIQSGSECLTFSSSLSGSPSSSSEKSR